MRYIDRDNQTGISVCGRTFYAIPDGSYLFVKDGKEELRGEAYMVKDGSISRISSPGETVPL